jgi:Tfp pilus assembly protein PilF
VILASASLLVGCPGHTRDVRRAETRNDLAKDLLTKGDLSAAETEIKKALAYDPENEEAYLLWGLVEISRAKKQIELVERSDCLDGVDAEALRGQADEHMRAADKHLAKATELAPDYGEAWQNRGAIALYFQDWDKAIEHENKALANLARLTSEMLARANLGWAHFKKQELVPATTSLLEATQGTQYMCLGNYRLAEIYFARGELEDAYERLRPVLDDPKICPPLQEAQYLGGQVFMRLHDAESAERVFNQCISMAPKSCQARECDKARLALTP